MSIKISTQVWQHYHGGGSELLCLLALADWSNDDGYCYPSIGSIAKKVRLKERQAKRVVHQLIKGGFVRVVGNEFGGPPGSSRKYRLIMGALTGVAHDTPTSETGVAGDTGVLDDTGVMQDLDGCRPRHKRGVAHDTLTAIEPSLTVSTNRALRFDEFWTTYPTTKRKGSKTKCFEIWKRKGYDAMADQIMGYLRSRLDDYAKDSGQYCPMTTTFLNAQGWDGAASGSPGNATDDMLNLAMGIAA